MSGEKIVPALANSTSSTPHAGNRRWFAYLAAALCGYTLFLVITLPAYWMDWIVSRASQTAVRIQQPEGTLWSGSGTLVIQSANQNRMQNRVSWSIQPLWLLAGKLQARLGSGDDDKTVSTIPALTPSTAIGNAPLRATLRIGYHSLSIRDVDIVVPVSVLSVIIPALDLVAPSGQLKIGAQQATLTPAGLDGGVQLTWLNAGARLGGLNELGDYRLNVIGSGPNAELRVETLRGDVGVTAQGSWQAQGEGRVQLSGNITPGGREQSLRPLLTMLNIQNNNGQYGWTLNSRFSPALLFGAKP